MEKRRLFIGLFILVGISGSSYAQNVHIGVTTAVNATFVLDKGLSDDPRYNSTYTFNTAPIGVNFGVDFGSKFGLSLESILSHQGQIYEVINAAKAVSGERKIDLTYIHIPLLMNFMSGGNGGARANFNIGPQLSLLTSASETLQYQAGDYDIPDDPNFQLPDGAQNNGDGTYTVPATNGAEEIYTKSLNDFKEKEFQIAAAFGLTIDIAKHMYLTTQIRANYSLTDMKNGDAWELVATNKPQDIFSQRANLLVGIQLGLHYSFGVTRSFK